MYHVILAGGFGSRFWPESRRENPKQLLKIIGQDSMIKMKRALVVLSMLIVSSSLAGCIEENGKSITYYSDYDCDISWHIEFFDLSSNDFGEW